MAKGFYKDVVKLLKARGYHKADGGKGSHEKWVHEEGPTVIVPFNMQSRHTANSILTSAGIDQRF